MSESTGVEDARKRSNDKINSPEREYILFLFRLFSITKIRWKTANTFSTVSNVMETIK